MNPIAISIGPLQVHWYGLLIVGGAILAAYIATLEAKRRGEDPEHVWSMLTWVLIFGIIGARLYHVFSNPVDGYGWSYYREHPLDIINFWSGGFRGLGIYGGIVGGLLGMLLYLFNYNRGRTKRLERAKQLLERLGPQVGEDLVQALLAADISTLSRLAEQRERIELLRERLQEIDGWKAASLSSSADVFAQARRPLFDGDRQKRLAQAKEVLQGSRDLVGDELADAILTGDTSTAAGRDAQKGRVAELKRQLEGVDDWEALELDRTAGVLAERQMVLSRWMDIVAPGLLLAQAVGRLGNRINQELYGPPTDLPWGFKINPDYPYQPPPSTIPRPPGMSEADFIANTRFHPTFYYEALWNLVGFGLLMFIGRRFQNRLRDGDLILLYLIWYPLGRIIVEMFRPDAWVTGIPGLTTAQLFSLAIIAGSVIVLILRHRNWSPNVPESAAPAEGPVDLGQEASS